MCQHYWQEALHAFLVGGTGAFVLAWPTLGLALHQNPTAGSPMTLDPLVLLQGLEELYLTLKQQSNYPPGEQIASDKKFKAMQGEVKKLKEELGKLTQDRSASFT